MSKSKSKDFLSAATAAIDSGIAESLHDTESRPVDPRRRILSETRKHIDVRLIPLDMVKPDPHQPRKKINEATIIELADSIKNHGILQPLTVEYNVDLNLFQIRLGQRRYEAARYLGLKELPCIISDSTDDISRFEQQLIENIQREDFNPLDKARGMLELKSRLNDAPWSVIEEKMGISESRRKQFIRLLDLPEYIQKELVAVGTKAAINTVTEKHARALKLLNEQPDQQKKLFNQIKQSKEPISGEQAIQLARKMINITQPQKESISITFSDKAELLDKLEVLVKNLKKELKNLNSDLPSKKHANQ